MLLNVYFYRVQRYHFPNNIKSDMLFLEELKTKSQSNKAKKEKIFTYASFFFARPEVAVDK